MVESWIGCRRVGTAHHLKSLPDREIGRWAVPTLRSWKLRDHQVPDMSHTLESINILSGKCDYGSSSRVNMLGILC